MSNTVKLYKVTQTKAYQMREQGEFYSLQPYFSGSTYYEGEDDGGKEYILPEGYKVAESVMDELQIYNDKGEYCQLIKKFNSPCLVTSEGEIILKNSWASQLGSVGGSAKSESKSNASRENGKLGGRPRKAIAQAEKEGK